MSCNYVSYFPARYPSDPISEDQDGKVGLLFWCRKSRGHKSPHNYGEKGDSDAGYRYTNGFDFPTERPPGGAPGEKGRA